MTAHISDDLPTLLTGEADRDTVLGAAAHLRTCVDCQQELVSAVVAHASLTSAQRFAPEIVARHPVGNFDPDGGASRDEDEPDEGARTGHEVDSEHGADHTDERGAEVSPLPDLSVVFEQVRKEAAAGFRPAPQRAPRRGRLLAVAAAVVVAAGAGVAIYASTGTEQSTRTVALAAFDKGSTSATARIGDGTIDVTATSLPTMAGKRYEIWLTNSGRTRMQPIGWIGNNGTAHLTVPSALMSRYNDLEVSVQDVGATRYDYSGTSVLRGSMN